MNARESGAVGPPIPGCELRLLPDREILCRVPSVFSAYFKDPVATVEALDAQGWLHTGDIGTIDDGQLRFVDRKKEIIVTSGGKNISPVNLESALIEIPLLAQACVVGDRRPYVTALLVLDADVASAWAADQGIAFRSLHELARHPGIVEEVNTSLISVNQRFSKVERIKKVALLGDTLGAWLRLPYPDIKAETLRCS